MADELPVRPRVIFASASVGAGHNEAARALMAGLQEADPSIQAERVDLLGLSRRLFRLYYADGYAMMMSRLGGAYGIGYRLADRPRGRRRTLLERRRLWCERWATRRFRRWVLERRPAVVVNTHFLAMPTLARLIGRGCQGLRQMTVVTDHHMHRFWCGEHVDRFFVPDEDGRSRLLDFGVAPERIELSGIPVHPKWLAPVDEPAVRARWDLPPEAPVVLVAAGVTFTVGRVDLLAAALCQALAGAVVVVLAGENKKLLARLAGMPQARGEHPRLRVIGFTDRIHELVHVAELVVTKPGGMSISEAVTKGSAILLLDPVPGQEAFNARMLCANGAAVQARTRDEVVARAADLLNDPAGLARMRRNARRLARPATQTIVARIRQAVDALQSGRVE